MTHTERTALTRLAASPEGVPFGEIPDGHGHMPLGRKGALERTLCRLRDYGLVEGADGGTWFITPSGRDALAL